MFPASPLLAKAVENFCVGVLLPDEEVGGDLRVQPLLGNLVQQLVLELVNVTDGLQDHVQLGDGRFPGNGRHQVLEPLKLDGRRRRRRRRWRRIFVDSGSGLDSSERIRRLGLALR